MIVKDEAHVIERCLASVRPLIDYALVVDTGSRDGTQDVVRRWLASSGVAGEVVDVPWRDFAFNRSDALARLRAVAEVDYALVIDADDRIAYRPGFDPTGFKASLAADLYDVTIELPPILYARPQICSNRLPFRFRGVLHEFLEGPETFTRADAVGFSIVCSREEAAARIPTNTSTMPRSWRQRCAMRQMRSCARATRSTWRRACRDSGSSAPPRSRAYLARASPLGFWSEEVFDQPLRMPRKLMERPRPSTRHSDRRHLSCDAYEICAAPSAAPGSLHAAWRAYCPLAVASAVDRPPGRQGVRWRSRRPAHGALRRSTWIYDYGLLDEFSIAAYWAGHFGECLAAAERLLSEGKVPEQHRPRILENARFARERLAAAPGRAP